jgi:hypothetical protein
MRKSRAWRSAVAAGERGSVLLVVIGVLAVLALVGLAFVLFSRTGSATARNFQYQRQAEMQVQAQVAQVRADLVRNLYPAGGSGARLSAKSYDYPNAEDPFLFGYFGAGGAVLQTSYGGSAAVNPPQVDLDGDGTPDSVWRVFPTSDGLLCRVAVQVVDEESKANVNVWGNTAHVGDGGHGMHQGLWVSELNLQRVLGLGTDTSTYRQLFIGATIGGSRYFGRYGFRASARPGAAGVDDNRDSNDNLALVPPRVSHIGLIGRDDEADGGIDNVGEAVDEAKEYCVSNPYVDPAGPLFADSDRPFDLVDQWELLRDVPTFASRLEMLLRPYDLSSAFASGTVLGPLRRNLTTWSGDPEYVGMGAADTTGRLSLRVDLNTGSLSEIETAFRQAGFGPREAMQMAVNVIDYRDRGDHVTAHPRDVSIVGHKRQPYINEFFVSKWKAAGSPNEFRAVAVELYNPYDTPLNVYLWELRIKAEGDPLPAKVVVLDDSANDGAGLRRGSPGRRWCWTVRRRRTRRRAGMRCRGRRPGRCIASRWCGRGRSVRRRMPPTANSPSTTR